MREADVLGIFGGLGPLASAQVALTLYRAYGKGVPEQRMARVVMVSDPTMPDRSELLLRGEEDELLRRLVDGLELLRGAGAQQLVVCCFTIHHLLPRLPARLRDTVISLPELALDETLRRRRPALLLCSRGTRALGIFPAQARWPEARSYIRFPSDADQERVHRLIHDLKGNGSVAAAYDVVAELARAYEVDHVITACTELHLVACHASERGGDAFHFIDAPSLLVARLVDGAQVELAQAIHTTERRESCNPLSGI